MPSVLITGVSAGIGRALAKKYLQHDWKVYGISRRPPGDLVDHPRFRFCQFDLAEIAEIEGVFEQGFLPPDNDVSLIYLNAGISGEVPRAAVQCSVSSIQSTFLVNVLANKVLLDSLLPRTNEGSSVVFSASIAGRRFRAGMLPYSISKSALLALCGVYAKEHPDRAFFAIGMCNVKTTFSESIVFNSSSNSFPEIKTLQDKFGLPGYAVTPDRRAEDLFYLLSEPRCRMTSGEFYEIRDLLQNAAPSRLGENIV